MKPFIVVVLTSLFSSINTMAWDKYLEPSAASELPTAFKLSLVKSKCKIPQVEGEVSSRNIIHGEFAKKGQTDWAVLCYFPSDKRIFIVMHWGGSIRCEKTPGKILLDDTSFRQHFIGAADIKKLQEYGMKSAKHAGVEFFGTPEVSTFYYCQDGEWKSLMGGE